MEKKNYQEPKTVVVEVENTLLQDTSMPGGTMSGGEDEAKELFFDGEDELF